MSLEGFLQGVIMENQDPEREKNEEILKNAYKTEPCIGLIYKSKPMAEIPIFFDSEKDRQEWIDSFEAQHASGFIKFKNIRHTGDFLNHDLPRDLVISADSIDGYYSRP